MMKAGSYQAWWLAAMMKGGLGMFSWPVTDTRQKILSSRRTSPMTRR
jgi:hypothetical protein